MGLSRQLFVSIAALGALVVSGCAGVPRLAAVPEAQTSQPRMFGISNARYYLDDQGLKALAQEAAAANERERKMLGGKALPPAYLLAISGGGDDGAFGSGLLVGWTAHGGRPQFNLVTGISTGALSAPFAFLGSKYDNSLREIYTTIDAKDVFARRSIIAAVADDALATSEPLRQTILRYLTDEVVAAIAEEYNKGRLLLVMTTNLDAGKPVIWNIGAIAASGEPNKREMIARILLASASIPAALPPVLFDVELDGQAYQEMHVDGGAIAQAFLYPPGVAKSGTRIAKRKRVAYIIRNGRFSVPWQQVNREAIAIAGRASSTMIASNSGGDLYRIYAAARRDGVDFNFAFIGSDFDTPYQRPFEPAYMNKLYDYGFEVGRRGYRWQKVPPGFNG